MLQPVRYLTALHLKIEVLDAFFFNWERRRDLNPQPLCPYHVVTTLFDMSKQECSILLSYAALTLSAFTSLYGFQGRAPSGPSC